MNEPYVMYYYSYAGLPYCGGNKVPIHAASEHLLPPVSTLVDQCPQLDPERFHVNQMPIRKFMATRWPK